VTRSHSDYLVASQQRCEQALRELLQAPGAAEDSCPQLPLLNEASSYAIHPVGKLVRPTLCYAAASAIGDHPSRALDYIACAMELLHTYSLIHDDLPAMDDDDLRRGKSSLHKAYDEATAILVGDGLQARAFELITQAPQIDAQQKVAMLGVLAGAAGFRGMVGGQFIDIQVTGTDLQLGELQAMHALKTGALIRASLAIGGIAAGATKDQLAALELYGTHIGLAFQVVDDILDVEGDTQTLGKTRGKDSEADKPTYVKLLGLEGAKAEARQLLAAALAALENFGDCADHLRDLADYIVQRNH
jgi:geranylgeranyl pyrophosphate synthase